MGERISAPRNEVGIQESHIIRDTDFSAASRRRNRDFEDNQLDHAVEYSSLAVKWDKLLLLFGTSQARTRFDSLCQEYKQEIAKAKGSAEVRVTGKKITTSDTRKSEIHNRIMQTLRNLLVAKDWSEKDKELLLSLQERHVVEGVINEVYQV